MPVTVRVLTLLAMFALAGVARAEGGPGAIDAFKQANAEIIEAIDSQAEPADIEDRVDDLLDYVSIAEFAMSDHPDGCGSHCDEFESLVASLVRRNFLKRLAPGSRGHIEYVEEHVREEVTKVDTKISFKDAEGQTKTVEVDYVMHKLDGDWAVRDIITEGVSLAKNYKYEINKLYKTGGMPKVIDALRKKVESLEGKPPSSSK